MHPAGFAFEEKFIDSKAYDASVLLSKIQTLLDYAFAPFAVQLINSGSDALLPSPLGSASAALMRVSQPRSQADDQRRAGRC